MIVNKKNERGETPIVFLCDAVHLPDWFGEGFGIFIGDDCQVFG